MVAQQICPASGEVESEREIKKKKRGGRKSEKRESYGGMSVMQY